MRSASARRSRAGLGFEMERLAMADCATVLGATVPCEVVQKRPKLRANDIPPFVNAVRAAAKNVLGGFPVLGFDYAE